MTKLYKNINGKRVELNSNEYKDFNLRQNIRETTNYNLLKNEYFNIITEKYPLSKQIDIIARIGGYTDKDFNEMKKFIESKIQEYKNKKLQ